LHYALTKFVDGEYVHGMIFPEVIRIKGNHDYSLFGKMKAELVTDSGKKILITHGFQNDPWMTNPISRFATWCFGRIERLIPGANNIFGTSKRITNKASDYAFEQLKKYDVVVLGHTHEVGMRFYSMDERGRTPLYVNSGCCCDGKIEGILIDTKTDEIKIV
jgi:predicted phosphodiesterase